MRTRRRPLTRAQVGFRRVQINATAANGVDVAAFADAAGARQCVHALRRVMAEVPAVEFIMQRNAQTARLCETDATATRADEPEGSLQQQGWHGLWENAINQVQEQFFKLRDEHSSRRSEQ